MIDKRIVRYLLGPVLKKKKTESNLFIYFLSNWSCFWLVKKIPTKKTFAFWGEGNSNNQI